MEQDPEPTPEPVQSLALAESRPWDKLFGVEETGDGTALQIDTRLQLLDKNKSNAFDLINEEEKRDVEMLFILLRDRTNLVIPRRMGIVREPLQNLLASIGALFVTLEALPNDTFNQAARDAIANLIKNRITVFWLENATALRIIMLVTKYEKTVADVLIDTSLERKGEELSQKSLVELAERYKAELLAEKSREKSLEDIRNRLTRALAGELQKKANAAPSDSHLGGMIFDSGTKIIRDCVVSIILCEGKHKYGMEYFIGNELREAGLNNIRIERIEITRGEYAEWRESRDGQRSASRHRVGLFQGRDPRADEVDDRVIGYRLIF